jgi:hypothetical protein
MKIKATVSVIVDSSTLINPENFDTQEKLADLALYILQTDIESAIMENEFDQMADWEVLPE